MIKTQNQKPKRKAEHHAKRSHPSGLCAEWRGPSQFGKINAPRRQLAPHLPLCSVIRPISTAQGGAKATVAFFKSDGLFIGQKQAFLDFLNELAEEPTRLAANRTDFKEKATFRR